MQSISQAHILYGMEISVLNTLSGMSRILGKILGIQGFGLEVTQAGTSIALDYSFFGFESCEDFHFFVFCMMIDMAGLGPAFGGCWR